ncbi:hypothetical protein CERZMDRAFT_109620 [Cercospora zeae-maydis SCOH1-5]|uniref:Uncharacterized protein n=1 Tax=Cercospora zeae-maydis SCOH1-5 TaxID=717836 RepID=A0A6A6FR17_9PEZI|nr:hypothetical protein CERZMDRAFT_109620 [Cercospora zeae-maydis SCOH1-5]
MHRAKVLNAARILADINYYLTKEKGGGDTHTQAGTAAERLEQHDVHAVTVTDVRSVGDGFSLDTHGFQYLKNKLDLPNACKDKDSIITLGYEKSANLIRETTQATRVVPFGHVHRVHSHTGTIEHARQIQPDEFVAKASPSMYCHIDQSPRGAIQLLRSRFSPEGAAQPLIVWDFGSVKEESDLCPSTAVIPKAMAKMVAVPKGGGFEMWVVAANEEHKWYWMSAQQPDEPLLLKIYDSKKEGIARFCPHTAVQT